MRGWIPVGLQTIAILAGAFTFSSSMEHRFTVMEETLKSQSAIITAQQESQRALTEQLIETQREVEKIIALEEILHHQPLTRLTR